MDNYIKSLYLVHFIGQCREFDCEFCKWEKEESEETHQPEQKSEEPKQKMSELPNISFFTGSLRQRLESRKNALP
jgi:hypothetical protein